MINHGSKKINNQYEKETFRCVSGTGRQISAGSCRGFFINISMYFFPHNIIFVKRTNIIFFVQISICFLFVEPQQEYVVPQ